MQLFENKHRRPSLIAKKLQFGQMAISVSSHSPLACPERSRRVASHPLGTLRCTADRRCDITAPGRGPQVPGEGSLGDRSRGNVAAAPHVTLHTRSHLKSRRGTE